MAAIILPKQVLEFSLKPNQSLSQFNIPEHFKGQCKKYLHDSPPYGNSGSQSYQKSTDRFCVLNFDGLIFYNYHKGPEGEEFERCTGYATLEDVKNWQTAIKCLQRYCLNLLLAPRRQDFHEIKFSTGYYQYNIAKNFKGAVKILEAMGYRVSYMKNLPVKAKLKEPKNLPEIAKVLVDLVLFDFELITLEKCIKEYRASCGLECSIMDAWNARKNTDGGVQNALGYLHNYPPSINQSSSVSPPCVKSNNKPANNVNVRAYHHKNVPVDKEAFDQRVMAPQTNNKPAHDVVEKPFDPSTLPPPYIEPSGEFESVAHINPSSHYDDENELIKDSTQLGYRNPPEVKPQGKPLQPMGGTPGYLATTSGYGSPDWLQTASSSSAPVVTSSNKDGGSSKAHSEVSTSSAFPNQGHVNARRLGNDDSTNKVPMFFGSTVASGELRSLPSGTGANIAESTTTNNQPGSLSHTYNRQKSVPSNTSLSVDSEKMAPITNVTTNSRQLADSQVLTAAVPIANQPTPEVSQVPSTADSKFGSTNLGYLKNKLQHKKEVTKELVQYEGAGSHPQSTHPQSTSAYANNEITFQGASDSTNKPISKKTDLINLRSRLEKTKEEREKTVVAGGGVNKKACEYYNINELGGYNPENTVMINNPPDKKPIAAPRTITPANQAGNITHSASSASSSKRTYRLWQCAHCETINEGYLTFCGSCKVARGKMADRSYLCEFCQLMIFIQNKRDRADTCCPRCKLVFESTL